MDISSTSQQNNNENINNTASTGAAATTTTSPGNSRSHSAAHQQQQPQHHHHDAHNLEGISEQLAAESARVQIELERLKTRRRMIEEQRRALAVASHSNSNIQNQNTTNPNNNNNNNRSTSAYSHHSRGAISHTNYSDLTNVITHSGDLPPGGTKRHEIIPEAKRRNMLINNPHYQMKEAIKESLLHDSTIVGGTFMPNPHASRQGSFSRAARFSAPVNQNNKSGLYYLSYDMQQLQGPRCRGSQRGDIITASGRGRVGTNVNSHWNDAKGGVAPGPGAYTPRYWFATKGGSK